MEGDISGREKIDSSEGQSTQEVFLRFLPNRYTTTSLSNESTPTPRHTCVISALFKP